VSTRADVLAGKNRKKAINANKIVKIKSPSHRKRKTEKVGKRRRRGKNTTDSRIRRREKKTRTKRGVCVYLENFTTHQVEKGGEKKERGGRKKRRQKERQEAHGPIQKTMGPKGKRVQSQSTAADENKGKKNGSMKAHTMAGQKSGKKSSWFEKER